MKATYNYYKAKNESTCEGCTNGCSAFAYEVVMTFDLPWWVENPDPLIYMNSDNFVTLDFETTTLDKGSALNDNNNLLLACWQVGHDSTMKHCWGDEYSQQQLVEDINKCSFIVAHSAKFELQWLARCGVDLHDVIVYDTMLGEWVLSGNRRWDLSLEESCKRHGLQGKDSVVSKMIRKWNIPTTNIPKSWMLPYCANDVDITRQLFYKQRDMLRAEHLLHIMYSRCLLTPVLADIETNGLTLDKERVKETYEDTLAKYEKASEELREYGDINWRSRQQLAELLYDQLGFAEVKNRDGSPARTPSGDRRTDASTLSALRATTNTQRQFIKLVKEQAALGSRLSKALTFFNEIVDNHDCTFYGNFNQGTTGTHRLSSTGRSVAIVGETGKKAKAAGPQLQNLPREYKQLFVPKKEGWKYVEADGCFTKGHKILLSDMTWKNVEDVVVGDELVGIQENIEGEGNYRGRDRKLVPSTVEAARVLLKPCIKLNLSDGTSVVVSEDHPFLARDTASAAYRWETAEWVATTRKKVSLRKLIDVHNDDNPRGWGKLAAYIDGDGCVSHDKIQLTQQDGSDVCRDMEDLLDELGIKYTKHNYRMSSLSTKPVASLTITGMQNLLKISQLARPVKLERKPGMLWEGKCPKGHNVEVISCERVGEQAVYAIQTSSKTYVAEGLFSHNCQLEFRVGVELTEDRVGYREIVDGVDVHMNTFNALAAAGFKLEDRTAAKPYTFKPINYCGLNW